MKAKHIICAALILILPFVLIFGFGSLRDYFALMGSRTYVFGFIILNMLTTAIPIVAYVFWLSFVMRAKEPKAKILLMCCSFVVATFLLIIYFGYWAFPFPISSSFVSTTALICFFANLFAAIYMLVKHISKRRVNE